MIKQISLSSVLHFKVGFNQSPYSKFYAMTRAAKEGMRV
jgi:hypothetical protein